MTRPVVGTPEWGDDLNADLDGIESLAMTAGVTAQAAADLAAALADDVAELPTTFARVIDGVLVGPDGEPIDVGASGTPVSARIDIVTAGKADIVSKVDYLSATITVTGVPGVADFAGLCQIRGRGNYTWSLPKKPYKLKFAAAVPLMGMPAFNDWALLANATDPSKINNALAFAIGQATDGLDWTPRSEYADLYLNGEYAGLYQLTETVKRGADRVAIDKAGTTGLALTGGYMLEGDADYVANGDPGFTTSNGVKVIYDDPDGANSTQATYIVGKVQEFEDALFGSSWLDPTTGYARFIDRDSFIDDYLISELASNQEAAWHSSKKFYRTRDTSTVPGRFFMGPLWDYDISFGSVVNVEHPATGFYARTGAKWIARMFQDPTFRTAVAARWTALAARLTATATGYAATIDTLTARVASATLADQVRWSYSGDWKALADFKKAWLAERIAWMTSVFAATQAPSTAPGGLTATPGSDYVILEWTNVVSGPPAVDYIVQQNVSGTWTTVDTTFGTEITVDALTPSTAYDFRVAGRNDIGTGPYVTVSTSTTADVTVLDPDDVTGLAFWLRADDLVGANGSTVAVWEDFVGTRDVSASGSAQPTVVTAGPNGHKSVKFDGVDDTMASEATGVINLPISSVFIVMRADVVPAYMGVLTNSNGGDFAFTADDGSSPQWYTGNGVQVGNFERDGSTSSAISTGATWHVYSAVNVSGAGILPEFRLGNDRNNGGRYLNGQLAEIVTYDRVLTTSERAAVTAGLRAKYATP